jgi:hypothetical protein
VAGDANDKTGDCTDGTANKADGQRLLAGGECKKAGRIVTAGKSGDYALAVLRVAA